MHVKSAARWVAQFVAHDVTMRPLIVHPIGPRLGTRLHPGVRVTPLLGNLPDRAASNEIRAARSDALR